VEVFFFDLFAEGFFVFSLVCRIRIDEFAGKDVDGADGEENGKKDVPGDVIAGGDDIGADKEGEREAHVVGAA